MWSIQLHRLTNGANAFGNRFNTASLRESLFRQFDGGATLTRSTDAAMSCHF